MSRTDAFGRSLQPVTLTRGQWRVVSNRLNRAEINDGEIQCRLNLEIEPGPWEEPLTLWLTAEQSERVVGLEREVR